MFDRHASGRCGLLFCLLTLASAASAEDLEPELSVGYVASAEDDSESEMPATTERSLLESISDRLTEKAAEPAKENTEPVSSQHKPRTAFEFGAEFQLLENQQINFAAWTTRNSTFAGGTEIGRDQRVQYFDYNFQPAFRVFAKYDRHRGEEGGEWFFSYWRTEFHSNITEYVNSPGIVSIRDHSTYAVAGGDVIRGTGNQRINQYDLQYQYDIPAVKTRRSYAQGTFGVLFFDGSLSEHVIADRANGTRFDDLTTTRFISCGPELGVTHVMKVDKKGRLRLITNCTAATIIGPRTVSAMTSDNLGLGFRGNYIDKQILAAPIAEIDVAGTTRIGRLHLKTGWLFQTFVSFGPRINGYYIRGELPF